MSMPSYWYEARRGKVVRIGLNPHDCTRWGVWLNEQLLCDGFGSAEEAALCANRRDFSTMTPIELFGGISVPSELRFWRTAPPEQPVSVLEQDYRTECKNRLWKPGGLS